MKFSQIQQLYILSSISTYLLGILTVYSGMPEIKAVFSPYSDIALMFFSLLVGICFGNFLDLMEK